MSAREAVLSNPHFLEQIVSKYDELMIADERSNAKEANEDIAMLNNDLKEINQNLATGNVVVNGVDQAREQERAVNHLIDAKIRAWDSYVNVAVEKARLQLINRNFRTAFNSLSFEYMP